MIVLVSSVVQFIITKPHSPPQKNFETIILWQFLTKLCKKAGERWTEIKNKWITRKEDLLYSKSICVPAGINRFKGLQYQILLIS